MGVRTIAAREEALRRIVAHLKQQIAQRTVAEVKLNPSGSITISEVRSLLNKDGFIVKRVADSERYVAASMTAKDGFGVNLETTWAEDLRQ
jgi:phosphoribosylformylglycinamidine (FGAM) synthase-like amidotransferase family enzyme